jgi:hypothetical protein
MKQTAVEWLFAHLLPHLDWSKTEDRIRFRQLEQEAKAMEKEQIVDAYLQKRGKQSMTGALKNWDKAEQYYTETYKK